MSKAISTQMQAAWMRKRRERTVRIAKMAGGDKSSQQIASTAAAYWSERTYVPDYAFIEDHSQSLIRDAQRRLMWGHRLHQGGRPFAELMLRIDWALDSQDMSKARLAEKQRKAAERRDERRRKQKLNYKPKSFESLPAAPRRHKKRKNRTRDERIADLRKALANQ